VTRRRRHDRLLAAHTTPDSDDIRKAPSKDNRQQSQPRNHQPTPLKETHPTPHPSRHKYTTPAGPTSRQGSGWSRAGSDTRPLCAFAQRQRAPRRQPPEHVAIFKHTYGISHDPHTASEMAAAQAPRRPQQHPHPTQTPHTPARPPTAHQNHRPHPHTGSGPPRTDTAQHFPTHHTRPNLGIQRPLAQSTPTQPHVRHFAQKPISQMTKR